MPAYVTDLLVWGAAFLVCAVLIYRHDRKPRNRYRRHRREVLPPPSPNCRRDYA
jgi:hypothetical protein